MPWSVFGSQPIQVRTMRPISCVHGCMPHSRHPVRHLVMHACMASAYLQNSALDGGAMHCWGGRSRWTMWRSCCGPGRLSNPNQRLPHAQLHSRERMARPAGWTPCPWCCCVHSLTCTSRCASQLQLLPVAWADLASHGCWWQVNNVIVRVVTPAAAATVTCETIRAHTAPGAWRLGLQARPLPQVTFARLLAAGSLPWLR